jgi:Rps23 Pro-64 3,4-dihydroxylase Tpa1-like proline 4-hydroxylase
MKIIREPFPHWVGQLADAGVLERALDEFPGREAGWVGFSNPNELKLGCDDPNEWSPAATEYFTWLAEDGRKALEAAFGMEGLELETVGGGYHMIPPGGYLGVHADFNRSPKTGRYRRLNVLTFLNHGWKDEDGGHLELWDDDGPVLRVAPEFGTTVAFETSSKSFHGHPVPTLRPRLSLAGYFFQEEVPETYEGSDHSTVWKRGA